MLLAWWILCMHLLRTFSKRKVWYLGLYRVYQDIHSTAELPHLSIPQLKFVEAGVFTVMSGVENHLKSGSSGPTLTFLIEERIKVPPNGTLTKYIHNRSPCPILESFEEGCDICLFLCACQHLQYIKTHKVACLKLSRLWYPLDWCTNHNITVSFHWSVLEFDQLIMKGNC